MHVAAGELGPTASYLRLAGGLLHWALLGLGGLQCLLYNGCAEVNLLVVRPHVQQAPGEVVMRNASRV